MILLNLLQALDHSDFDWSDPKKLMEKSTNLNLRILKTHPKIRFCNTSRKRNGSILFCEMPLFSTSKTTDCFLILIE